MDCPECGATNTVKVWEDPDDYDEQPPDLVGCYDCRTMTRLHCRKKGSGKPRKSQTNQEGGT